MSLDQATETITATLVKCEFYHSLYDNFAKTTDSKSLEHQNIFRVLECYLPEIYAAVIEVTVKTVAYMETGKQVSSESSTEPADARYMQGP